MNKLLAHLMVIVMCMPSLVCAMPFCVEEFSIAEQGKHCDEQPIEHQQTGEQASLMLIADCDDVELFLSSFNQFSDENKPDSFDDTSHQPSILARRVSSEQPIRGSPAIPASLNLIPIYLHTQRIRI